MDPNARAMKWMQWFFTVMAGVILVDMLISLPSTLRAFNGGFDSDYSPMPSWGPALLGLLFKLVVITLNLCLWWWLPRVRARRERNLIGRCPHCQYDRKGLAETAVCPECGRPGLERPAADA